MGAPKGGSGAYNWGDPMDYYGEDDVEAWDEEAQQEEMARREAAAAEQKAAEKEYRRAEQAEREARDAYVNAQKAKKAALQRHAAMNPYASLNVEDAGETDPLGFSFDPVADRVRALQGQPPLTPRQMRREEAEWNMAIAEHRRIMHAEGMWARPPLSPGGMPPAHPHPMSPLHGPPAVAYTAMQRAAMQQEHIAQLQIAQAAQQYRDSKAGLSMQQQYEYHRGPNEKSGAGGGQRFQPRGHARFGH